MHDMCGRWRAAFRSGAAGWVIGFRREESDPKQSAPGKLAKDKEMKVLYGERLANRPGPE